MTVCVAYLSQGKLYLKSGQAVPREIDSQFGQTVQTRSLQMQRNKAWKTRSLRDMMMPPGLQSRLQNQPDAVIPVAITSLCPLESGQVLYALAAGEVGGIFAYDPSRDREDRLFHNSEFRISHLDYDTKRNLIACSVNRSTGIANLAIMPRDAVRLQEVTEGDSLDLAPRWLPGSTKALVYQSAGLGRTLAGHVGDRAPFTIEKLDFEKGDVISLAADPKADLVAPQMDRNGMLYYIRRPYRRRSEWYLLRVLLDILLIPFRFFFAVFQWLNYFTEMYTGKPLLRTENNQTIEPKSIHAWGSMVDPKLIRDRSFSEPDAPSLVPKSWQLIRQAKRGATEVLAEGVLAYDVAEDGSVIYTNGSGVYRLANGSKERLFVDQWIEAIITLPTE